MFLFLRADDLVTASGVLGLGYTVWLDISMCIDDVTACTQIFALYDLSMT